MEKGLFGPGPPWFCVVLRGSAYGPTPQPPCALPSTPGEELILAPLGTNVGSCRRRPLCPAGVAGLSSPRGEPRSAGQRVRGSGAEGSSGQKVEMATIRTAATEPRPCCCQFPTRALAPFLSLACCCWHPCNTHQDRTHVVNSKWVQCGQRFDFSKVKFCFLTLRTF